MRLQVLWRKENLILPLRQSNLLINKHFDCYCSTVTVSFLNCYCLTSPQIFNYSWSYRTQIYNLISRYQFIIDFETTHKTMFRIPYLVWIKVSIPPFLSNDSRPSPLLFLFNFFLLIPCPPVFILPITLNLVWVLEILVFLSWFAKIDKKKKLPFFFPYGCCRFLVRRWVFMLYNYFYLHFGPIFFKCIIFAPTSFFLLIIKLYLFSFLIISPHNF
jgi:hypothetical protein